MKGGDKEGEKWLLGRFAVKCDVAIRLTELAGHSHRQQQQFAEVFLPHASAPLLMAQTGSLTSASQRSYPQLSCAQARDVHQLLVAHRAGNVPRQRFRRKQTDYRRVKIN